MASTQLLLNEKCTARLPVLSLNPHMTADVVRKEFTLPLLVHILASERLRQDVDCFIERGPYKQKGVVRQFAISAHHHLVILLGPTLVTLSEGLWGYRSVRASDQYLDGEIPTIGSLLDQAVDSLFGLRNSWESVVEMLAYNFPVSTGSVVPTASPRELLIRLLVNQPSILEKIATGGDTVLRDIGNYINLPSTLQIQNNFRKIMPKKRIADGSPKMFFVCCHTANGNRELFVGASQANWTGLPAIGRIRRKDRDDRLSSYIPLTTRAFNALRQAEENVVLPVSMRNLPKTPKGYQVRIRAIAAMRDPPHPDFLGRTTEVGQAFDKTMRSQQCCYACKGMMGYRVPAGFSQDAVMTNLRDFCWKSMGNYTHACAEAEVSLQCSMHWVENGRGVKY
ncbi:MAG: hypothetical protein M1813_005954 [Trichoglossum hirsutum]|nr:MAG: hypothetical protein M1813_005954 [Trichoglossum hirsutum]